MLGELQSTLYGPHVGNYSYINQGILILCETKVAGQRAINICKLLFNNFVQVDPVGLKVVLGCYRMNLKLGLLSFTNASSLSILWLRSDLLLILGC